MELFKRDLRLICRICGTSNRWDNSYCIWCGEDDWQPKQQARPKKEEMMVAEMSEVFVKCPGCGQHNKLRIAVDAPYVKALTHEEQFMAYIQEIVNELGGVLTSREIARHVAGRILAMFNPVTHGERPSYMIQVSSGSKWHDIDGAILTHLL